MVPTPACGLPRARPLSRVPGGSRAVAPAGGVRTRVRPCARAGAGAGAGSRRDGADVGAAGVGTEVGADGDGVDVVLITNGPGELTSWVQPVAAALRAHGCADAAARTRVSVVLTPCPHASGAEPEAAMRIADSGRVCVAGDFFRLLLFLRGAGWRRWGFRRRGVVVFLGGDQLHAVLLAWRLGYACVIYAEEEARWPRLARYALRSPELLVKVPQNARERGSARVVGDLFADAVRGGSADGSAAAKFDASVLPLANARAGVTDTDAPAVADAVGHVNSDANVLTVGLLPGSKLAKLLIAVPFMLATADALVKILALASAGDNAASRNVRFVLPLAPTADVDTLARCARAESNEYVRRLGWAEADLEDPAGELEVCAIRTRAGTRASVVRASLHRHAAPYEVYTECDLVLTTIGTNTAELGVLGVPMVVVLPTQALEVFKGGAGGIAGLLCRLPGALGDFFTRRVNAALLAAAGALAWPNRWAGREVVPELVGALTPETVARACASLLLEPARLRAMRAELRAASGSQGAAHAGGAAHALVEMAAEAVVERWPQGSGSGDGRGPNEAAFAHA